MTKSSCGVEITTCGENMPTWASPEVSAAAAEEAPWMKIKSTLLPYFSKSLASLVTHNGANWPTSLVQTTLILVADAVAAWNASQAKKNRTAKMPSILFIRISLYETEVIQVDLGSGLPVYCR